MLTAGQLLYREYLSSDHWRSLRLEAFRVHGRKCFKCPATFGLDVHHLIYRHPWTDGVVDDVRPCCRSCHEKEHGIVNVVDQSVKLESQKKKMMKRVRHLERKIDSRKRLSPSERLFLHHVMNNGTPEERCMANALFHINSRLPARRGKKKYRAKMKRKHMKMRNKYSRAFRVRW